MNTAVFASQTQVQVTATAGGANLQWATEPLHGDFTFNGGVSIRVWGREAATGTNAGIKAQLFLYDDDLDQISNITGTVANTTEFTTAIAARTINTTPSITVKKKDRIILRLYANNVGTMANGWIRLMYNGATSEANGDCYMNTTNDIIQFSKNRCI